MHWRPMPLWLLCDDASISCASLPVPKQRVPKQRVPMRQEQKQQERKLQRRRQVLLQTPHPLQRWWR